MHKPITPEQAIEMLDLYGPMVVADFGTGSGYFALLAAHKISADGKVYAFDVQETPLAILRKRAHDAHLFTIETLRADLEQPEGSRLVDRSVDAVIIANILFQSSEKQKIIAEAFRILKNNGKLLIVDWISAPQNLLGPRHDVRLSPETVRHLVEEEGGTIERELRIGDHHFGVIARKTA